MVANADFLESDQLTTEELKQIATQMGLSRAIMQGKEIFTKRVSLSLLLICSCVVLSSYLSFHPIRKSLNPLPLSGHLFIDTMMSETRSTLQN